MSERFFRQAWQTMNSNNCKPGDIIDAYNQKVIAGGCISYYNNKAGRVQDSNSGSCGG